MNGFWIGFLMGILIFPVLFALIPGCFGIPKAKYLIQRSIKPNLPVSNRLKMEICKSLISTSEMPWINVIIQRLYFDTIRNYYFEYRIRQNIMKSFASVIGDGLLKNVKITGLNFGVEAPFFKSIKLITPEEYESIIKSKKSNSNSKENGDETPIFIRLSSSVDLKDIKGDLDMLDASSIDLNSNLNISEDLNTLDSTSISNNFDKSNNSSNSNFNNSISNSNSNDSNNKTSNSNRSGMDRSSVEVNDSTADLNYTMNNNDIKDIQEVYKNATFLGRFEYDSGMQIMIEIELPRGIYVNSTITLRKVHSDFLFRIPAENYNTRYEICLIGDPNIEIDVQSGLVTGDKKLYFQNSISSLLRRTVISTFKKTFLFPSWWQISHPMVPSSKLADFTPRCFDINDPTDIENSADDFEKMLLMMSTDFKIVECKNQITFKKSHCILNDIDYVNCWSFKTPKTFKGSEDFTFFEGLNSTESKILHLFESLEILKSIFPIERSHVVSKKRNISSLTVETYQNTFEVMRMVYKNNVLFFRNDPKIAEFIGINILDGEINIFNFSNKSLRMHLNSKKIARLKELIHHKSTNSTGNYRLSSKYMSNNDSSLNEEQDHSFSNVNDISNMSNMNNMSDMSDDSEYKGDEIEMLLKDALDPSRGSFEVFRCSFKIRRNILKKYVLDDLLRIRVFDDSAKIISSYVESRNIKTFIVECISRRLGRKEKFKVHTFYSRKFIIDFCPERDILLIYSFKADVNNTNMNTVDGLISHLSLKQDNQSNYNHSNYNQVNDKNSVCDKNSICDNQINDNHSVCDKNSAGLNIIYKSPDTSLFPNSFIEHIKIRSSFEKYLIRISKIPFEKSPNELKIEGYVNRGTIFFEFNCEKEDDYSLVLFSCKKQIILFETYKIITNKPFTLIYPVESDYIRIKLTPKHRSNDFINYKFKNFEYERNILVKGSIGLNTNHKFKIKIQGYPTHVIFWEKDPTVVLKNYIQDSEGKNEVSSSGIIRSEEREYLLVFKNKTEKKRNIEIFSGITELS